jgi:hypothetical protein
VPSAAKPPAAAGTHKTVGPTKLGQVHDASLLGPEARRKLQKPSHPIPLPPISHIIHGISSIKWQWIVRFTQRFFNTAGVGVCFQSQRAWERIFAEPGFDVVAFQRGLLWWWLGRSLRWMMPRLFVKAIFTRSLFSEAEAGLRGGRRSALRYAGLRARPSDTCKWQRSDILIGRLHQKMLAQGRNVTRRAK